jgi:hypothetical protein
MIMNTRGYGGLSAAEIEAIQRRQADLRRRNFQPRTAPNLNMNYATAVETARLIIVAWFAPNPKR